MASDVLEHVTSWGWNFMDLVPRRFPAAQPACLGPALASARAAFRDCGDRGMTLSMVNLGSGFPTKYLENVPTVKTATARRSFARCGGFATVSRSIVEPGRGLVGYAGVIEAEVVLVSKKSENDDVRWVYLDIGKFGGLAETMDE